MLVKNLKYFLLLLIVSVILALIIGIINGGLNLGIDFTGGSLITVDMGQTFDSEAVRDQIVKVDGIDNDASVVTSGTEGKQAIIKIKSVGDKATTTTVVNKMIESLKTQYPKVALGNIDSVGGVASGDMVKNAFSSVIIASLLMLVYIWIRFDLSSGLGSVLALLHDVTVMTCAMCIFRVQVDSTFIAACLTIVGYSINATVVTYDRIRENMVKLNPNQYSKSDVVDISVRQTVMRNINTSLTTLIMVAALYVFGVQSIKIFTLPLIVGIVSGTYSSILIAPPLWKVLSDRIGRNKKHKGKKAIR